MGRSGARQTESDQPHVGMVIQMNETVPVKPWHPADPATPIETCCPHCYFGTTPDDKHCTYCKGTGKATPPKGNSVP